MDKTGFAYGLNGYLNNIKELSITSKSFDLNYQVNGISFTEMRQTGNYRFVKKNCCGGR